MSVLLTSAGRRVELTRAFKAAVADTGLGGGVVATDVNPLAPALHFADRHYIVPPTADPAYASTIVDICRKEQPLLVFPMIDPDIPLLAEHRGDLEATGARVMVASEDAVDIGGDKWKTFELFQRLGVPTVPTRLAANTDPGAIDYPVFVKPRFGSASENTFVAHDRRELEFFLDYVPEAIVQPKLTGYEVTSDVFCDFDGGVLAVVQRKRLATRSGEVAKGVTVHEPEIERHCVAVADALRAPGPLNIQCFVDEGKPVFTEINCRFGGGSPLAIEAGVPFARWFLSLAAGGSIDVPPLGTYRRGVYLTRFDRSIFLTEEEYDRAARRRI